MNAADQIKSFAKLGEELGRLIKGDEWKDLFRKCFHENGWFTEENVRYAVRALAESLEKEKLEKWVSNYVSTSRSKRDKTVGVVMAGNIPAVGFHDFLCVLMSGHKFLGKLSSDDKLLLPAIAKLLVEIEPAFEKQISFTEKQLKDIDAVIATGSNNTSRYFEYYFSKYPHIIRKNRNAVAVLDGTETKTEMEDLGHDIFRYFGLGCRNVSKLFVPQGYSFERFFEAVFPFNNVMQNNNYANNYEYNRTIYLMNNTKLFDNNFLLLKEDIGISSPVGVLYYEFYENKKQLNVRLRQDAQNIQCVVSSFPEYAVPFGKTQHPGLQDYADGLDTMKFMLAL